MSDPYMLRLELLKLSQDILEQQNSAKQERLRMEWDTSRTSPYPDLPTIKTEDVIETAQLLNEFISRKS